MENRELSQKLRDNRSSILTSLWKETSEGLKEVINTLEQMTPQDRSETIESLSFDFDVIILREIVIHCDIKTLQSAKAQIPELFDKKSMNGDLRLYSFMRNGEITKDLLEKIKVLDIDDQNKFANDYFQYNHTKSSVQKYLENHQQKIDDSSECAKDDVEKEEEKESVLSNFGIKPKDNQSAITFSDLENFINEEQKNNIDEEKKQQKNYLIQDERQKAHVEAFDNIVSHGSLEDLQQLIDT